MTPRACEDCGRRMSPHWPRKRLSDGRLACPSCHQRERFTVKTSSYATDEHEQHALFGCYHHALGRALKNAPHTAKSMAAPLPEHEQEERLTGALWKPPVKPFEPVRHVIEGARGYASKVGMSDPHPHGFHHVLRTPDDVREIGRAYQALPEHDEKAVPHYDSLAREVHHQFEHMTKTMGIKAEFVEHDPYKSGREMAHDLSTNKRIQVLKTSVTGGHPHFDDDTNDKFRAVHDVFGHAATGRSFDKHGEEAAWVAHSQMFTHHARRALTTETRGQNSFYNLNGKFADQKIALLPEQHADHTGYLLGDRTASLSTQAEDHRKKWRPQMLVVARRISTMVDPGDVWTPQSRLPLHAFLAADKPDVIVIRRVADEKRRQFHPLPRWNADPDHIHPLKREDAPHWAGESELGSALRGTMESITDSLHGLTHPQKAVQEGSFPIDTGVERWRNHPELGGASTPHNPDARWGSPRDLHPRGRELGLPNLRSHQDPHDKDTWSNISGCPHTYHEDDPYKAFPPKEVSESGFGGVPEHPEKKNYLCPNPNCGAFKVYHAAPYDHQADTMQRLHTSEPFTPRPPLPHSQNSLRTLAHDSGDGETIFHCLAGETRYLTRDGIKTLAETVGTTQMVLTNPGNGGSWVEAEIRDFGEQRLYAVTVQRNKTTKIIHATDGHRWVKAGQTGFVTTMDLKTGDRLPSVLPRSLVGASTPSPFGIAHGIVFGDGTWAAKGSVVRLWGEKDAQLLRYFPESRMTPVKTENGVEGQMVLDLPAFFKDRPSLDESIPYLYGWLAGYFAADGSVSKQGQAILTSASRSNLEFVQTLCLRLGVATHPITEKQRQGYGADKSALYGVQFVNSTLRPNFFLVREHQDRYVAAIERGNPERLGWTVVSVEQTERVETVYCAVVPGTHTFVLEDYLLTGNCPFCGSGQVIARSDGTVECEFCTTAFTVQVQPEMSAMPQTIDGVPVDIPDMPNGGENAMVPPQDANGDGMPDDEDPMQQEAPDEGEDDDKPAFLKGSSQYFITDKGVALDEDSYVRHLAIKHAANRRAVIEQVKSERNH